MINLAIMKAAVDANNLVVMDYDNHLGTYVRLGKLYDIVEEAIGGASLEVSGESHSHWIATGGQPSHDPSSYDKRDDRGRQSMIEALKLMGIQMDTKPLVEWLNSHGHPEVTGLWSFSRLQHLIAETALREAGE